MSNSAYAGAGVGLSSSYFMRSFYSSNRDMISTSLRTEYSDHQLSYEDATALRRAVNQLGSFSYSDDDSDDMRNTVLAFVETYNNLLSSSDSSDREVESAVSQMKNLTNKYSSQLDKVGITVNSDGTLTSRESLISTASVSKFKSLFSSDSEYMKKTTSYARRLQKRSNELVTEDIISAAREKNAAAASQSSSSDDQTAVASIVEESLETDTGVGTNVDVSL